ncbi:MAG: DUF1015 domain-containing protein [Clostridia bacterium]|nr:DUF1015 domain-containing protein [Clostridia bacterium]
MVIIKPFRAVRPEASLADKVAALPYDVMNAAEARLMAEGNPYSFLHVDKAEINFAPDVDPYSDIVYHMAATRLREMLNEGVLLREHKPCLYVYRQTREGRSQTGVVGCAAVDEYLNKTIRIHELTRADKEDDRVRHIDACNANTGPIFLAYRARPRINEIVAQAMHKPPLYDFNSGGVQQTVWLIDEEEPISILQEEFARTERLYIADGHHRSASAARVAEMRRAQQQSCTGAEEFNFFLSVFFPDEQLYIMPYNRVIKDLGGLTAEQLLARIEEKFSVRLHEGPGPCEPAHKHSIGMYLRGKWYLLTARPGTYDEADPVARLDVSILQDNLLFPILGIANPRIDGRIGFLGGSRGLIELERRAGEGGAAFAMHPTSIDDLIAIADAGQVMPTKSTWFEPKLLSGLFIHELS